MKKKTLNTSFYPILSMVIEIKITPRRIERTIFLLIIAFLLVALYYYGYDNTGLPSIVGDTETIELSEGEEETEQTTEETDETVSETVVEPEPEEIVATTSSGATDGKITVSIGKISQDLEGEKRIIKNFQMSVTNGKEEHLSGLKVDIIEYDKDDIGQAYAKAFKPSNKDISIAPIPSGGTSSNVYLLSPLATIFGKGQLKFVVKHKGNTLEEITKSVD